MEPQDEIKSVVTKNGVLVVLTLPVIFKDQYVLKNVFALPHHMVGNEFVIPSVNYSSIGINLKKKEYFSMKNMHQYCKKRRYHPLEHLCAGVEMQLLTPNDCVVRDLIDKSQNKSICPIHKFKIEGGNFFQELFSNVWFYFVENDQTIKLNCGELDSTIFLNKTGIIHLSSKCRVTVGSRIIGGKLIGNNAITETKLKIIDTNFSQLTNDFHILNAGFHYKATFNDSLIFPMANVTVPQITRPWNEYHHTWEVYKYIILALIILLIVFGLIIYCVCFCYCKKTL